MLTILGVSIMNTKQNALKNEESPYLRQHSLNPVNWLPWGKEALERAKREDKLIFLSIGYSTCHWCHVMERESFENEEIAEELNRNFISIKMDREEYPNIDKYYQEAYRRLNGRSGGWPLSVFLTPDAKVFFVATYIPATPKYGYKPFIMVLRELNALYREKRDDVIRSAKSIENALKLKRGSNSSESLDKSLSSKFLYQVKEEFDFENKGIGDAPKFPHATTLNSLLEIYKRDKIPLAKEMAIDALRAIIRGGINDQIEGGFYRYSVDKAWQIPHFEKMLYTNAELIETFSNAHSITKDEIFKRAIEETISNIYERFERENLFFSASDADSEGKEGWYFVFEYREVKKALEQNSFLKEEIEEALEYFNITKKGNFEDNLNNPYITTNKKPKRLKEIKSILKSIRAKREYPFIDYKIQTSWNSLFITALFKSGYRKEALKSLNSLIEKLYIDNILYHQVVLPNKPKIRGYLEDYSFLTQALIEAYVRTLDREYLKLATKLNQEAKSRFYRDGIWYMSSDEFLVDADIFDGAYRSALAVNLENTLRLSLLNDDIDSFYFAKEEIEKFAPKLNRFPFNYPYLVKVALNIDALYILKSNRKNLLSVQNRILKEYPNILLKETSDSKFNLCSIDRCFRASDSVDEVLESVN
jgi:uncharacterized protein YyaL (SSP411 family)